MQQGTHHIVSVVGISFSDEKLKGNHIHASDHHPIMLTTPSPVGLGGERAGSSWFLKTKTKLAKISQSGILVVITFLNKPSSNIQ